MEKMVLQWYCYYLLDIEWYIQDKNVQESYKKEQDTENYDSLSWEG